MFPTSGATISAGAALETVCSVSKVWWAGFRISWKKKQSFKKKDPFKL